MIRRWGRYVALVLGVTAASLSANESAEPPVAQLAAKIDRHIAARAERAGVSLAAPADDAEFLRRVYLDLTGTIPTVAEARAFLADNRPRRRAELIRELLHRPGFAEHWSRKWSEILVPASAGQSAAGAQRLLQTWLFEQLQANRPYDEITRELLASQASAGTYRGPQAYVYAHQRNPEKLAANSARVFLGVQLDCAQCHDHPFEAWKQDDFWSYAALFTQLAPPGRANGAADSGELKHPDTGEVVVPRFLGAENVVASDTPRHEQLAAWMVSDANPRFAQATVNRVWWVLFGRGIVDPVDDFGDQHPPSHPELLADLAGSFRDSGYDLRRLVEAIVSTQAYQRTSRLAPTEVGGEPSGALLFARMAVKPLAAGQMFDCLEMASGPRLPTAQRNPRFTQRLDPRRSLFIQKFADDPTRPAEYQSGIPQALTLLGGEYMQRAVDPTESDTLAALAAPFLSDADRVDILYLATLTRYPDPAERERLVAALAAAESRAERQELLSDLFWALLNSGEFALNH